MYTQKSGDEMKQARLRYVRLLYMCLDLIFIVALFQMETLNLILLSIIANIIAII